MSTTGTDGLDDVLGSPAPQLTSDAIATLLAAQWGASADLLSPLGSERDLNVQVGDAYVLKVSNAAEDLSVVEMEVAAAAHLRRVEPALAVPATQPTRTGELVTFVIDDTGRRCAARLLTLLPGAPLEGRPLRTDLAEQMGATAALTSIGLSGFFHPAAGRAIDWDVRQAATVVKHHGAAVDSLGELGAQLRGLTDRFATAAERTAALRGGVQHADVTLTNVLADDVRISGLIDFGDMHFTAAVCDLAVTLTSVLRNSANIDAGVDLWDLSAAVLNGYQRHRFLTPEEVDVLGELVLARLALTLVISARRTRSHPDNVGYISRYDVSTRQVLSELMQYSAAGLAERFAVLAGTRRARVTAEPDLLNRRRSAMGGRLAPLFYDEPLEIVGGQGPWLLDAAGDRYLDAYNNVAVVGHAHPVVTQAVSRQLALVNTHSRYLHRNVVELAERLLATMPAGLDTCLFTTSGTEANELAWRMATAYTGGTAAIVADHAYHGSSRWLADLSPNEWPVGHRPAHVGTFTSPSASDPALSDDDGRTRIAAAVQQLGEAGDRPALVLADLGFTSAGIHDAPPAFIRGLLDGTHRADALFLADEVQSGFGRSGAMWRFEAAGITPDFVTLGKPMGAGYPIGALITRRDIADALAADYEYFSTFAATPAAAAASLAVLDILETERLLARAATTGAHLRRRLADLAQHVPTLGGVRGTGLIAGVDVRAPAGGDHRAVARQLLNLLARQRVLAGLTGPTSTVLKIRPPLVWQTEHADHFVDTLGAILRGGPDACTQG